MPDPNRPANETVIYPFSAFNFRVEIEVKGVAMQICDAAFSDCDGLEMTMDVKTIREGGNNDRQIRFTGPASYGSLTLKRGMTATFDLWRWMELVQTNPGLRADAEVVILSQDHSTVRASFVLSRCVPIKLRAPPLNARDGTIAVEEFQLAYESIRLKENK